MKNFLYFNCLSFIFTYLSLFYQKYILVERTGIDEVAKVKVIAGGFPLQFLVDGEISPGGSIALDPLNIIIGIDQFIFLYFIFDYLFWISVLFAFYIILKRYKLKQIF